jgi:hypothetical protein
VNCIFNAVLFEGLRLPQMHSWLTAPWAAEAPDVLSRSPEYSGLTFRTSPEAYPRNFRRRPAGPAGLRGRVEFDEVLGLILPSS